MVLNDFNWRDIAKSCIKTGDRIGRWLECFPMYGLNNWQLSPQSLSAYLQSDTLTASLSNPWWDDGCLLWYSNRDNIDADYVYSTFSYVQISCHLDFSTPATGEPSCIMGWGHWGNIAQRDLTGNQNLFQSAGRNWKCLVVCDVNIFCPRTSFTYPQSIE